MKNKKGFTLAELLVVVAVIAVLVAVAIPTFSNQLEKSRQAVDIANLRGAYAAAKLATMDQKVGTQALDSTHTMWVYNPDDGLLIPNENTTIIASNASTYPAILCGKAKSASLVADTSNLDNVITSTYMTGTGTSLPTDGKGILITFELDDGRYKIKSISFVAKSS